MADCVGLLQIEKDKTIMQRKIITACDACENSQEVLDTAIREEVNWLEKTSEIKYQLNRCLKRAAALTLGTTIERKYRCSFVIALLTVSGR